MTGVKLLNLFVSIRRVIKRDHTNDSHRIVNCKDGKSILELSCKRFVTRGSVE